MAKKKGGTIFGNLLAKVANVATGGILGAKRVEALNSGNLASINPTATSVGKTLMTVAKDTLAQGISNANTEAAGLTKDGFTVGFGAEKQGTPENPIQLNEVKITPQPAQATAVFAPQVSAKAPEDTFIGNQLGNWLSFFGKKATENATVGADKTTLLVVGGGLIAVIFAIVATKK